MLASAWDDQGKVAFIFPGQGSQRVGMGRELFESDEQARKVFDLADKALGEPLSKLCFEGPAEELALTRNTQPAVLTCSVALCRALGETPDCVAGHSLGEYSAHVAAGTLDLDRALRLVRIRGDLMQRAVPVGLGGMAAILNLERETVVSLCEQAEGTVEAVNFNTPNQIVVAGERMAVENVMALARESKGAAVMLPVSAPFHSSMMKPAEDGLERFLEDTPLSDPDFPVYSNVDAQPVTRARRARDCLVRQVSRPVRWEETIKRMVADGTTVFVEFGASTLAKMIKRITSEVTIISIQSPSDFGYAHDAIATARAF